MRPCALNGFFFAPQRRGLQRCSVPWKKWENISQVAAPLLPTPLRMDFQPADGVLQDFASSREKSPADSMTGEAFAKWSGGGSNSRPLHCERMTTPLQVLTAKHLRRRLPTLAPVLAPARAKMQTIQCRRGAVKLTRWPRLPPPWPGCPTLTESDLRPCSAKRATDGGGPGAFDCPWDPLSSQNLARPPPPFAPAGNGYVPADREHDFRGAFGDYSANPQRIFKAGCAANCA
jgi:hypothetical protein